MPEELKVENVHVTASGRSGKQELYSQREDEGETDVWEEHLDNSSGRIYYYNTGTGETSWTKPSHNDGKKTTIPVSAAAQDTADWIGDEWTGVREALLDSELERLATSHEETQEAAELAAELEKVRRSSFSHSEDGASANGSNATAASQFSTSMKMLKTQMVFQKYKDKKKPRDFRNREASQFKDSFHRIKSIISENESEQEMIMYKTKNKLATVSDSHELSAQEDRAYAAAPATFDDESLAEHQDGEIDNIIDMFMSPDATANSDIASIANELDNFASPAVYQSENVSSGQSNTENTESDFPEVVYSPNVDLDVYAHKMWTAVLFRCVVFVNYESRQKQLVEMPLWLENSMLQLGTVIVAWEGLIFHHTSRNKVKVPYDKIISWTIETSSASEENFVDITMDGTFDIATGNITWFTNKLLEIRCCVESQKEARTLSTCIKDVCMKIRQEAMSSVDVSALRQSSIGKAFMSGVENNDHLMNAKQRRASLMRK